MGWRDRVLRPSTRAFFRLRKDTNPYGVKDFLHGYVYARWPYFYIGIATGEHPLSPVLSAGMRLMESARRVVGMRRTETSPASGERFADTYHGKVMPLQAARQLITVGKDFQIRDLEHVIPYARARDIILRNPDHIVVLDCPCRSARNHPCLPLDVCLIIGEPFASFVHDHHPGKSRWITPEEAIRILEEEDARGHVHHAFFKDAMLNRFYAICNCCACCCGAMQAHRNGTPMLASSGYVCAVNHEVCQACGTCAEACQFGALSIRDGILAIERDRCMGCGVCLTVCDQGALTLERDATRGTPLEIHRLLDAATAAGGPSSS